MKEHVGMSKPKSTETRLGWYLSNIIKLTTSAQKYL